MSRFWLTPESRHLPPRHIFDVRQKDMKAWSLTLLLFSLIQSGCGSHTMPSSDSIAQAESNAILIARYVPVRESALGVYEVREVWAERSERYKSDVIIVRLGGSHYGDEPRVRIVGMKEFDYLTIWSERNGPPYEIWKAPNPLPSTLVLEREGKEIILEKK
jgi:hypothetical protein